MLEAICFACTTVLRICTPSTGEILIYYVVDVGGMWNLGWEKELELFKGIIF